MRLSVSGSTDLPDRILAVAFFLSSCFIIGLLCMVQFDQLHPPRETPGQVQPGGGELFEAVLSIW